MIHLSVIVLSFNTKDTTIECLTSLHKSLSQSPAFTSEVIIIDNASADDSVSSIQKFVSEHNSSSVSYRFIANTENLGFVKGNNQALKYASGRYVLYLNSDAIVEHIDFSSLISYLDTHEKVGGITVRLNLPSGSIDPASHRGFPTPWNAFCYYAQLERLFGRIPMLDRIVGGYHLTYHNLSTPHQIDSPSGAFFLCRKSVLDKLGGFDEDYFMYGEDLDLAYRMKHLGYEIWYLPEYTATHLKYRSGLKTSNTNVKSKTRGYFFEAMRIFYRKHYESVYPRILTACVFAGISLKERFFS